MKHLPLLLVFFFTLSGIAEDQSAIGDAMKDAFKGIRSSVERHPETFGSHPDDFKDFNDSKTLFHRFIMESTDQRLKLLLAINELNGEIDYYNQMRPLRPLESGPVEEWHLKRIREREILAKEYVRLMAQEKRENSSGSTDPRLNSVIGVIFKAFAPKVDDLPGDVESDPDKVKETANAQRLLHRTSMECPDVRLRILFAITGLNSVIPHLESPEIDLDSDEKTKKDYLRMIEHRRYLAEEYIRLGKESQSEPPGAKNP